MQRNAKLRTIQNPKDYKEKEKRNYQMDIRQRWKNLLNRNAAIDRWQEYYKATLNGKEEEISGVKNEKTETKTEITIT